MGFWLKIENEKEYNKCCKYLETLTDVLEEDKATPEQEKEIGYLKKMIAEYQDIHYPI